MVTTIEVLPIPALSPFVRCYTYREFNTHGQDIVKPWHAAHELYFPFFFIDVPRKMVMESGRIIYGSPTGSVGMVTRYMGDMTLNGNYSFISIQFRPNGFTKIFRNSSRELTNNIINGSDLLGNEVNLLFEQLCEAGQLYARKALLDKYLLTKLSQQSYVNHKDAITSLSNSMAFKGGFANVQQLAYHANMSVRNFERRFNDEVGMSPKLYGRISRFNKALEAKLKNPGRGWAAIAQDWGYFDQMHLIKDFKELAGSSPYNFVKYTPLLEKDFSSRLAD